MKVAFAYNQNDGTIETCPRETQLSIYNRYKEFYGLTEDQIWDYGLSEWEDLDEDDLAPRPSEEVLNVIGDDMQLIGAFIDDGTLEVKFETIEGMVCGRGVAELTERIGIFHGHADEKEIKG